MDRKHFIWIGLALVAFPLSGQGIIDSLFRIEGVEITPERTFERKNAGMTETKVDSAVLQDKTYLSLSDLLSENTALFVKEHGRGALATASFRGTAPSHTRVDWNGITINSPMAGMVDFSLIPAFIIDELELKHGPASIGGRSGGIGGSIHIGNSAGWDRPPEISYLQGIGSYHTWDELLKIRLGKGTLKSKTRIYHNYSRNDFTFINRGIGHLDPATGKLVHPLDTNDQAAFARYGLLQEFYYRPAADHVVSLKYWGQAADRTIPRATTYEGPDYSNLNRQGDTDHRVVAEWKYYGTQTDWLVRTGYSNKQLSYDQMSLIPGLGEVPAVHSVSGLESFFQNLEAGRKLPGGFTLEGSLQATRHRVSSKDTVTGAGYGAQRNEWSLMAALSKGFGDRLNVKTIWRQDWVHGKRQPLIPYLGMDLRLIRGADLFLKASLAGNYHMPSLNDLYWQPGGNPELLPEEGTSAEAGLDYRWSRGVHRFRTGITAYRSDIRNWIIWLPSLKGYWEPYNIRLVRTAGVESMAIFKRETGKVGYRLSATYAFTRSINLGDPDIWGDSSHGRQLPYIPLHSGNVMAGFSYGDIYFSYQFNAYSERHTTSSNDLTRRDWLYPYFMNNLKAGALVRVRDLRFTAEIRVYNLFNESYRSVLYRPMPGRNYHLGLIFRIHP